jgi:phage terminase large subunit-like protein
MKGNRPLPDFETGHDRTNATGGITIVTFTPLLGMSELAGHVVNFLQQK